jgi:nucleoside diphosphate kinase
MSESDRPVEHSYMADIGVADRVWEGLARSISLELLAQLERLVFVIIKPDAIAMGVHRQIFESIERRGWRVLSARTMVAPRLRSFEELYAFNLTARNEQNQMGVWWLNSKLYTAGASIALMLHVPARNAYEEVIRWKGPSNPFAAVPGQIRHDAGGSNTALNLVHCADGPVSTAREFLIFNDLDSLVDVLRAAAAGPGLDTHEADIDTASVLARPGRRALDLPSAVIRAKLWLGACGLARMTPDARNRTARQVALIESDLRLRQRWKALDCLLAEERAAVRPVPARQSGVGSRADEVLNDPASFSWDAAATVMAALQEFDVVVDVWDRLALETGMHYAPELRRACDENGTD